jgi:hypothetical protein
MRPEPAPHGSGLRLWLRGCRSNEFKAGSRDETTHVPNADANRWRRLVVRNATLIAPSLLRALQTSIATGFTLEEHVQIVAEAFAANDEALAADAEKPATSLVPPRRLDSAEP